MKTKVFFKLLLEIVTVIIISLIYGAGTGWLGAYIGSNSYYMAESDAMLGAKWLVVLGTMSYYIFLRKNITLHNFSGLMAISFIVSLIPAILFHISTTLITSFCIIIGSMYIWITGNKKAKLKKEN